MRKSVKGSIALFLGGVAAFALAPSVRADFAFDPDNGGPIAPVQAFQFDWKVGNGIAVNGNTAIRSFLAGGPVVPITTLYQANLGTINNQASQQQNLGNINLPGGYEITVVARITETVVAAVDLGGGVGVALFKATPTAGDFLEIYFDSAVNANNLAGTGFNDGRLIYKAMAVSSANPFDSNFATGGGGVGNPLDQFGANNYPGIDTRNGDGASTFNFVTTYFDPAFFLGGTPTATSLLTTQQHLPYEQVDPSALFVDTMNAGPFVPPVGSGPAPTQPGATLASVGPVNADLLVGGPNVMFQTDGSQIFNFVNAVPEPSTVVLSLIGLGGCGFARFIRRRRNA
jgi:hypothetical protein